MISDIKTANMARRTFLGMMRKGWAFVKAAVAVTDLVHASQRAKLGNQQRDGAACPAWLESRAADHAPIVPENLLQEHIDIQEHGRSESGETLASDRRLFMQLLAFGDCTNARPLLDALENAEIRGVLYEDLNDPRGIALLTMSETPAYFIEQVRRFLTTGPFAALAPKPEYTMLGRTYAIGYETDLDETLVDRPLRRVLDPALAWAVWYPLRRSGSFEQLSAREQSVILSEHGGIGHAYGKAGYAYDIRLACHGLDKNDNDFVVGLLGPDLYPLSSVVQRMRRTRQTSLHLERLGPFFVGRALWRARMGATPR
jgi:chlorite dismutase